MFKCKVMSVVALIAIFMSGAAYCQPDQQLKTISGKVTKIDIQGDVVNVRTDNGIMVFYLLTESSLFQSTHHMASIEIMPGDSVIIQYVNSAGKNNIISLVDTKSGSEK